MWPENHKRSQHNRICRRIPLLYIYTFITLSLSYKSPYVSNLDKMQSIMLWDSYQVFQMHIKLLCSCKLYLCSCCLILCSKMSLSMPKLSFLLLSFYFIWDFSFDCFLFCGLGLSPFRCFSFRYRLKNCD